MNNVSNSKAWSFRIKKLPDKKSDLTDDSQKIARELFHANSGVVLGSDIFSRSPQSEQEKMWRPTLIGSNYAHFDQFFYTKKTTMSRKITLKP